ncbi:amino acid permease-domain-containing protein [Fusarium solani]|uniref:Amino acid permease-domain-containing protein n=1 Tax=Fusarium solani TaxID=169388 RepID=A0A9P9FZD9_FUSSL|nr:amino acid permease-domain-containing protein [Fusarium solani]KAH7228408.1 amino acid permease-domain-containing protein [Fusarium solani]
MSLSMESDAAVHQTGGATKTGKDDANISLRRSPSSPVGQSFTIPVSSQLQRRLNNRQIQLFAIGGTIGQAVFVSLGTPLAQGGPGNLLLGYIIYSLIMGMVVNCSAEMVTFMPVPGALIQHAGKWVDEAFGFMVGWNYFFWFALTLPFELVGASLVMGFWRDDIPVAAVICAMIVFYTILNIVAVNWFGEVEFWMSLGKVLLLASVFFFTFVTMVGGNPRHDAYGFRYWNNPGSFLEYGDTGSVGRFRGFLACFYNAAFVVVGPESISAIAGEARNPRYTIKNAFKSMYLRFFLFFVGSALCIGIVISAKDPKLVAIVEGTSDAGSSAAGSPYVIAASNLGISTFPSMINALLLTSIVSAGNNYVFAASRGLYAMAERGFAPKFLLKVTKSGVPLYCLGFTIIFCAIAFLQLSSSTVEVYNWLISLTTAAGLVTFLTMTITYIFFYRALKAQGIDRRTLPYCGWGQPYMAYAATALLTIVILTFGYETFMPWSVSSFFINYTFLLLAFLTFGFWKILKGTKFVKPHEADLVWERPEIDAHEASIMEPQIGFWREIGQLFCLGRKGKVMDHASG